MALANEEPALGVDLDALVEDERATLEDEREKHRKRQAECCSLPLVDLHHPSNADYNLFFYFSF